CEVRRPIGQNPHLDAVDVPLSHGRQGKLGVVLNQAISAHKPLIPRGLGWCREPAMEGLGLQANVTGNTLGSVSVQCWVCLALISLQPALFAGWGKAKPKKSRVEKILPAIGNLTAEEC